MLTYFDVTCLIAYVTSRVCVTLKVPLTPSGTSAFVTNHCQRTCLFTIPISLTTLSPLADLLPLHHTAFGAGWTFHLMLTWLLLANTVLANLCLFTAVPLRTSIWDLNASAVGALITGTHFLTI